MSERVTQSGSQARAQGARPASVTPAARGLLQRRGAGVPPVVHEVLQTPGQPLDPQARTFMESRFGHDFSRVRVHSDARASESARAVNALAYTVGHDVVFGAGRYAPHKEEGRSLIAHELAHVVQQEASPVRALATLRLGDSDSPQEHAADAAARAVMRGRTMPAGLSDSAEPVVRRAGFGEVREAEAREAAQQEIQPGDVVVRAGTFSGKNPLVQILGEAYNHGGVAVSSSAVHHVESNGYETVPVKTFFHPDNASGGAVIRFKGPYASQIRARVVSIAVEGRYVKIPGNPFSTAENLKTVNCNEFVHELFRQAIAELMAETQKGDPKMFQGLLSEYGDPAQAGKAKNLLEPRNVEFSTGTMATGIVPAVAELAGGTGVTAEAKKKGEVKVAFEGKVQTRNLYPEEWAYSWNPFKVSAYNDGFYTVAVLRTFTPDSFINSKYFQLVRRISEGGQ